MQRMCFGLLQYAVGGRQRGGVRYGEGNVQYFRQSLSQHCFSNARGAEQKNIALLKLDIAVAVLYGALVGR